MDQNRNMVYYAAQIIRLKYYILYKDQYQKDYVLFLSRQRHSFF